MAKRSSSFGAGVSEVDKKKVTKEGFKKALKIFRFTLPYKGTFAIGFIFLVLSQITSMSVPLLMGQMVGAIVSPKKLSSAVQTPNMMGGNIGIQKFQNIFSSTNNLTLNEVTFLFVALLKFERCEVGQESNDVVSLCHVSLCPVVSVTNRRLCSPHTAIRMAPGYGEHAL